ncbi:putative cytochrome P450 hydroxylase [Methyloceanibacter caenitepidi]|uniref:Putative cytochrome P450 hydroxylase n=2 Tax=Methyloceanibacter caenitepidi TaxID=1384459 RepID=A0A0A8K781_9HYPH|nr:putative cytochrome P450 hydroxylase [Methyloceanibacter caenitepidi]
MGAGYQKSYSLRAPLRVDLQSKASKQDPFSFFAGLREAGPVVPLKLPFVGRVWATTTYDATAAMLKDNALFVQEGRHAGKSGVAGLSWWMPHAIKVLSNNMLLKDEPDHRRLRKLVDQAFQRRLVRDMRGEIEGLADRILDDIDGRDEIDLVASYARRFPLEVICWLLGLPEENRGRFEQWAGYMTSALRGFAVLRVVFTMPGVVNYVREQIEECRRNPREGLISELVRAEEDGDKLSEDELLSMVFLLLFAGFETTTHLIADSVIALEQNPAQKAFLFADPATRMERAVEELGRYMTPVQSTKPRYVARNCDFLGQKLKRGENIVGLLAAANSDPAAFDAPDKLKLDRLPNPHLVFGRGIHFCLGMQLARVEAQSALSRLYGRYPDLALAAPDDLPWIERFGLRGVFALPVRLNSARARKAA